MRRLYALRGSWRTAGIKKGDKTNEAFDCSWSVCLVFHRVFPQYSYLNSSAITESNLFEKLPEGEAPKPGDVIYSPPIQVQWEVARGQARVFPGHVGVVLNSREWIGRQTSSLGRVQLNDRFFWGTRTKPSFYRSKGLRPADLSYLIFRSGALHA